MVVSIWGFMGSGKSTIGKYITNTYHWQHIDSDQEIESMEKKAISEIFGRHGERYFRDIETTFLKHLLAKQKLEQGSANTLLTTGGGMPIREENRKLLKELGPSIFLQVPFEEIARRLQEDKDRPLWDNKQLAEMEKKYEERLPIYLQADLCIAVEEKDLYQVVAEIKRYL